jgi:predicted aldo/keto reductase-like oxidoreductase
MNDESHIEENLRIADEAVPNSLTSHELGLIRRVADTYRSLMKSDCTGCRYCLPCPEGVDIPGCLGALNNKHALRDKRAKLVYMLFNSGATGGKPSVASLCTECGTCLPKCPQDVPIPDVLKVVAAEFEGPFFQAKKWFFRRSIAFSRWRAKRGRANE